MPILFPLPAKAFGRLSRLALATDQDPPLDPRITATVLTGVLMRVAENRALFTATDGKILVSIRHEVEYSGPPVDVILRGHQFTQAAKTMQGLRGNVTVQFTDDLKSMQFTAGGETAIVGTIDGTFPSYAAVWTRTVGQDWVPAVSAVDYRNVVLAQKISGMKAPIIFSSTIPAGSPARHLWTTDVWEKMQPDMEALRKLVHAPHYWCDREMAVLIMPINTSDAQNLALDLSTFA